MVISKKTIMNPGDNNKILVISDLDGTLLNDRKEITEYTQNVLNRLIEQGLFFSVATARTAATVSKLIEKIHVNVPIVLMNGVCIYDLQNRKYVNIEVMDKQSAKNLILLIREFGLSGFLYTIQDHILNTFYQNTDSPHAVEFIKERVEGFGKVFTKVNNFSDCLKQSPVYYSVADTEEKLKKACDKIRMIKGLRCEFYRDTYHDGFWYLEVCSEKASKYNAVEFLRNQYGFDQIYGFGDNLNDLSLFEACDRSFAVMNAKSEVKEKASEVIRSNDEDGVARCLIEIPGMEKDGGRWI
ncbi:MAG TPA: Cof-type HAD-IIB family hydrolase [Clostridiales bacterium]|nr:Cof-type HAD-IIB family hydrolase [Clostridiales bacterium]